MDRSPEQKTSRMRDESSFKAHRRFLISRRAFLGRAAAVVGLTAAQAMFTPLRAEDPADRPDPMKVPGALLSPYGKRSAFEQSERLFRSWWSSLTPLQDLHGMVTPASLHFERHHNGVPIIDPSRHQLLVHGMVHRPLLFTMDELKQFPAVSRHVFIECSGNSAPEWQGPTGQTAQQTHGLTSTSEWTGVRLSTILREAEVQPEAAWMLAEGGDAAAMTRSLPVSDIIDNALLCYAQNGEALRPEQGYPLRLVIPGWEGNTCIKWLRRLKLGSAPFMTREETSQYTDLMPDGTARQFTMVMEAKSVITSPSGGQRVRPGFIEIRGLAWSGRGFVTKVEVSTDGGRSWEAARLQEPVLSKCHTRFRLPWRWNGRETILQSRCIDETGYVQPAREALVAVRGVNSVYHYNAIQSWKLSRDGQVTNVHA